MEGRPGAALQGSRTATNANRWISRVYSRRSILAELVGKDFKAAGRIAYTTKRT